MKMKILDIWYAKVLLEEEEEDLCVNIDVTTLLIHPQNNNYVLYRSAISLKDQPSMSHQSSPFKVTYSHSLLIQVTLEQSFVNYS